MIHRGQIVERIVRKSGYNLTRLAERLNISRITLYNKFKKTDLSYRFIIKVGNVIHYDFTIDFPKMKKHPAIMQKSIDKEDMSAPLWRLEAKYTHLLRRQAKLLEILIRIANENRWPSISQEIQKFVTPEKI